SAVSGIATFSGVGINGTAGTAYTLTFASGGLASATQSITPTAGAATQLVITGTGTQTAGVAQTITVTAQDASGNTATTYTGSKSLTFSGANAAPNSTNPTVSATNFGSATSVTFTSGVATASMVLVKTETAVVAATDGTVSATGGNRLSVVVSAAAASATTSTESASPTTLSPSTTSTVTVTVKDAFGNIVTGATSASFVPTVSAGSIGTFTCVSGVCTATYTAPGTAGSPTITVKIGGTNVSGSPVTMTVVVITATHLTLTTSAAGAASGLAFTTQPVVALQDGSGNTATSNTSNVTMTVSSGATVIGTSTVAAVGGVATFSTVGLTGPAASYTLTFASTGLTSTTQSITLTTPGLVASAQGSVAVSEVTERIIFYVKTGGVLQNVTQATAFSLATNGGGTFYSDAAGTLTITTATIAAANDSLVFYYKQTTGAGTTATLTVTRTSGDFVAAGTAAISVTATTPAAARLSGVVCLGTTSNSTAASLTVASGVTCPTTSGQLLFMVYGHDANNTNTLAAINAPAGWTLLRQTDSGVAGTANQLDVRVYYQFATGADVTPTFSTTDGSKTRQTFLILAMGSPNTVTPFGADAVNSGATPGATITLPSVTATLASSSLLSYVVQNIGSNAYVAPAGLSTIAQAGSGGQAITMILFSKDRVFPGPTPTYSVGTGQTANAFVGGQVIVTPP
ncbi:MAG TPA: invasin domain 3-containing protein, partial [Gemmatimonadaceae bacterium]|nr:invasin domain 3-containing protein [Gemmatimonadaceae bacterium]